MQHPTRERPHVWLLPFEPPLHDTVRRRHLPLLAPDEATQYARFLVDHARDEYLLTRFLIRTVLSRYAPVAPEDWTFARTDHGRPYLSGPTPLPRIGFNLSNTRGLIAGIFADHDDIGIDVEYLGRKGETVSLANHYFAPAEIRALHALPPAYRRTRFFELWTLKEAYIKARGKGLSMPLDQFALSLDHGPQITIDLDPRLNDDAATWQFSLARPSTQHLLAWAIRAGLDAPPVQVETFTLAYR